MIDFKSAIFDADGTLLDSMHIWSKAAFESYTRSRPDRNDNLRSPERNQASQYLQTEYDKRGSLEDVHLARATLLKNFYFYEAQLKEGVLQLLDLFRQRGTKMCVATATDRWLMEPALRRCGILDYFESIFTCGEEETNKNSPDIYLTASASLGAEIGETLVFEDAFYAIKSAKKAGFPVVAVYDSHSEDQQDEIKSLCDYYCVSMNEFTHLLLSGK